MASPRKQVWETFLRSPEDLEALQDGAVVPLVLRDLTPGRYKYRMRHAMARITRGSVPAGTDELRVRTVVGVLLPEVWGARILKELPTEIPGPPYRHFYESLRAAAEASEGVSPVESKV